MFGLLGGFRGWPIQWNHAKYCEADPCCHGNDTWARRGDPVAYRLVYFSVNQSTVGFSYHKEFLIARGCVEPTLHLIQSSFVVYIPRGLWKP